MTPIHETFCVLEQEHYGPCAPTESEFYVVDGQGVVLWRQGLPPYPKSGHSDDPDSEYQQVYGPAYDAGRKACIEAAFRLGYLPLKRNHSRWTDGVDWSIEVSEIEERGDLLLTLPMGKFRLRAKRARKGEMTSEITVAFGGDLVGFGGTAPDDTDSPPVRLSAGVHDNRFGRGGDYMAGEVYIQPSSIEYADGSQSGFLGCNPTVVVPIDGYPRQTFIDGEDVLEEPEGWDVRATLSERRRRVERLKEDQLTEGLYHSGYTWSWDVLPKHEGTESSRVPNTRLTRYEDPTHGVCYTYQLGNSTHLLGARELVEQVWRRYLEEHSCAPEESVEWLRGYGPSVWTGEASDGITNRGCAGHEMHEWNAAGAGLATGEWIKQGSTFDWHTIEVQREAA